MSNDVLITPASRKIEFKDSSATVDAKIETDSNGNLVITNPGGDISLGDTTADVFIGDGANNVDIVFEQDGEIRGTSGVTITLGATGSNIRMASDLNLNSKNITNVNDITIAGNLTVNGSTVTNSATNTTIEDALIELGSGNTGANSSDLGLILERGSTGDNAFIGWQEANDRFIVATTTATGASTGALSVNRANLAVAKLIMSSDLEMVQDNIKIKLGAGSDLQLYHDGSHSYIKGSGSGTLVIEGGGDSGDLSLRALDDVDIKVQNGELGARFLGNGAAELYYDNSKKLNTTSTGVFTTGFVASDHDMNASTPSSTNNNFFAKDTNALAAENGGAIVFSGIYTSAGDHLGVGPYVKAYKMNANSGDFGFGLKLGVRENGSGGSDVAMTINSSGDVGIGTTSPSDELHVAGIIRTHSSSTSKYLRMFGGGSGNFIDSYGNSLYIRPDGNSSNAVLLDSSGNLGIGTTSPATKLEVAGNITLPSDGQIKFKGTNHYPRIYASSNDLKINVDNGSGSNFEALGIDNATGAITFKQAYTFPTSDGSANQVLQTDGSGNLSFATVTSGGGAVDSIANFANNRVITASDADSLNGEANLTFDGSTLTLTGDMTITDTSTDPFIRFNTSEREYVVRIDNSDADKFQIRDVTGTATRFTITTGGNVGIGEISPSQKLHVAGNIYAASGFVNSSGYQLNGTYIVDSSRNLVNIGTVSSGAITSTGSSTFDRVTDSNKKGRYTSLTGSSGDWFPILNIADSTNGPVIVCMNTYAHSKVTFTASRGYTQSNSASLTILTTNYNTNSTYANVAGLRIKSNGLVEAKLVWSSGPNVDIDIYTIDANQGVISYPASLATTTDTNNVQDSHEWTETGLTSARKLNAINAFSLGGTTVIDSSRNLNNLESINMPDSKIIKLGTGLDLQIYHNGTDSFINNDTGHLYIKNFANDKDIIFQSDDGSGGMSTYFQLDGSEVVTSFLKTTRHSDNVKAMFGSSNDMQLYHDGSNSYIANNTGNLQFDAANDIIIDAGGGDIAFRDDSVEFGRILNTSGSMTLHAVTQDTDILFRGNDGGSTITALTLDMSSEGRATFNETVDATGYKISGQNFADESANGAYHQLRDPTGRVAIFLGGSDTGNYHDNDNHYLRTRASSNLVQVNSNGLYLHAGSYRVGTTTVIDSSRNLINIGTITTSGAITAGAAAIGNTGEGHAIGHQYKKEYFYDEIVGDADGSDNKFTLKDSDGNDLTPTTINKVYRVRLVTLGTGTHTGAVYIADNVNGDNITNGNWRVNAVNVHSSPTESSNYPLLELDSNVPKVSIQHNSNYTVRIFIEEYNVGNRNGHHGVFGTDHMLTSQYASKYLGVNRETPLYTLDIGGSVGINGTNIITSNRNLTNIGSVSCGAITTTGDVHLQDNDKAKFGGASDLKIFHDGSNSIITQDGTGDLYIRNTVDDKDIILQSDDGSGGQTEYFRLDGSEVQNRFSKHVKISDNQFLRIGTGNDLTLVHDTTNSIIKNNTGDLYIENTADDKDIIFRSDDGSGGLAEYFRLDGGTEDVVFTKPIRAVDVNLTGSIQNTVVPAEASVKINENGYADGTTYFRDLDIYDGKGNEYVKFDGSTQRVGIGTTSPVDKLDVAGNVNIGTNKLYNSANNNSAGLDFGGAFFKLHGYNGIVFYSSNAGIGSQTERMRITSAGNVGIGTGTPDRQLEVYGTNDGYMKFDGGRSGNHGFTIGSDTYGFIIYDDTSSAYRFAIDQDSGNVGIGTVSPSGRLHVYDSGTDTYGTQPIGIFDYYDTDDAALRYSARIGDGSTTFKTFVTGSLTDFLIVDQDNTAGRLAFQVQGNAGNIEALAVDSTGKVGINETSPASRLHITGTDGGWDKHITIEHDGSDIGKILVDTDGMKFRNMSSGNGFYFRNSANTTQMLIDSSGQVGIGVGSNPGQKLDVGGIIRSSATNPQVRIHTSSGSNSGYLVFGDSADDDVGYIEYNHGDNSMRFITNASEDMRLTSGGTLHVDDDVIAFSSTISDERLKDDVITIESALDKVMSLRGVEYIWNRGSKEGQKDLGVIAQEVEQVLPEIVKEKEMPLLDGETYKTVDYEKLTAVLIEAVKEQQEEIEQLKKHSHPAKDMCDMNGYKELVARIEKMEKNYGNN